LTERKKGRRTISIIKNSPEYPGKQENRKGWAGRTFTREKEGGEKGR